MSYKNVITWAKINQIRLREPLETQTIQPKQYMKYAKEFGYAGQMLPILIIYMVIIISNEIVGERQVFFILLIIVINLYQLWFTLEYGLFLHF